MGGVVVSSDIQQAAIAVKNNHIILFPFDTVWGLAALATANNGNHIFQLKNRPITNPLIILVKDQAMANAIAHISPQDLPWIFQKWPGPYTLIFKKKDIISPIITGNKDTIAIRIPSAPWVRQVLELVDFPIISTSANLSGHPSPNGLQDIPDQLKQRVKLIYDVPVQMTTQPSQIWDMTQTSPKRIR